mmetsp:Transcript_581/g.2033  ORF Transcript_581/g.2033 Transcript_581/m.2033 type:complete len:272 (+) Transcript_581:1907-2722(+)
MRQREELVALLPLLRLQLLEDGGQLKDGGPVPRHAVLLECLRDKGKTGAVAVRRGGPSVLHQDIAVVVQGIPVVRRRPNRSLELAHRKSEETLASCLTSPRLDRQRVALCQRDDVHVLHTRRDLLNVRRHHAERVRVLLQVDQRLLRQLDSRQLSNPLEQAIGYVEALAEIVGGSELLRREGVAELVEDELLDGGGPESVPLLTRVALAAAEDEVELLDDDLAVGVVAERHDGAALAAVAEVASDHVLDRPRTHLRENDHRETRRIAPDEA